MKIKQNKNKKRSRKRNKIKSIIFHSNRLVLNYLVAPSHFFIIFKFVKAIAFLAF